jgi:predicted phage terminase large subunit-like protein
MVKREWFKRYKPTDLPSKFDPVVMSIDTANKATELSDFSALTIWGVKDKNIYLLHVLRRKMNYPDLKRAVKETAHQFEATVVLIEDRASGTQLIQELLADGLYSVKGIEPTGDKVMRLHAQTATIENGFVFIPDEAPWVDEYLHELTAFPNAKHDDQVDSTAQALQWLKATPEPGFLVYIREQLAAQRAKQAGNYLASVAFRVPEGIWRVLTLSGRAILVPQDRIIRVSEGDAEPCQQSGWERLD